MNEGLISFYLSVLPILVFFAVILLVISIIVFLVDFIKNKKIRVMYLILFIILGFTSYLAIPMCLTYKTLSLADIDSTKSQNILQRAIDLAPFRTQKGIIYIMKGYCSAYSNNHISAVLSYEEGFSILGTYKIKGYGKYIARSYLSTNTYDKAFEIASANLDYETLSDYYILSGKLEKALEFKIKQIVETKDLGCILEKAALLKALGRFNEAEKELNLVYGYCKNEDCKIKLKKRYDSFYNLVIKAKNDKKTQNMIKSSLG